MCYALLSDDATEIVTITFTLTDQIVINYTLFTASLLVYMTIYALQILLYIIRYYTLR